MAGTPVSLPSYAAGRGGGNRPAFCFSSPALFKPPRPWCCRWDLDCVEKGDAGSGPSPAEVSCVTAQESL